MSKKDQLQILVYATVSTEFATFCNPIMQGEKFNWNNFPDMAERAILRQLPLHFTKISNKEKEMTLQWAKEIGLHLIKEAGFDTPIIKCCNFCGAYKTDIEGIIHYEYCPIYAIP